VKVGLGDTPAARLRAKLSHPVVDADGHLIETAPVFKAFFLDYVKDLGGADLAGRFERAGGLDYDDMVLRPWSRLSAAERRRTWQTRPPWWSLPAANTLDRATAMLPGLMYRRLDELGIDFAVLYPTYGLIPPNLEDDEIRRAGCRAFNRYCAELYGEYRERLAPAAIVPMHTPAEAVEELEYCVRELGFRVAMLPNYIVRPLPAAGDAPRPQTWLDTYGPDSLHDYDPVWAKCVELGISPTFHSGGVGWGSRAATPFRNSERQIASPAEAKAPRWLWT